jgi:hypothetical protein
MKHTRLLLVGCIFATQSNAFFEGFFLKIIKEIRSYIQNKITEQNKQQHTLMLSLNPHQNTSKTAANLQRTPPPPAPYHQSTALFNNTELLKFLKERVDATGNNWQLCRYDVEKADCKDLINEYATFFSWYKRSQNNDLTDFEIRAIKKWMEETITKKSLFVENFADMKNSFDAQWIPERNLDRYFQLLYNTEKKHLISLRGFYSKIFNNRI